MPNVSNVPTSSVTTIFQPLAKSRWRLAQDGGIESDAHLLLRGESHHDHIEMSGRTVNAIVHWSVTQDGKVDVKRLVRWPTARLAQDDTHGCLEFQFDSASDPQLIVDAKPFRPSTAVHFRINGFLSWDESDGDIHARRTLFPSVNLPCLIEQWEITNTGSRPCKVCVPRGATEIAPAREQFKWNAHIVRTEWIGSGAFMLGPSEKMTTGIVFSCREENAAPLYPAIDVELAARLSYRDSLSSKLVLSTPDPAVNRLFNFSKLRAAENVLATRGGLMHAPGGFSKFLAALWCNDQNEYVSPFFAFLGDTGGNESALNAYLWFATYQNDAFDSIPASIVAEGRDIWNGAGDRGDAAMTAHGAARWALAFGDETQARMLWPFIQWCIEYCLRQKNANGVIESDSDELEGRFSTGRTNLATSCLTYDALRSAASMATALGEPKAAVDRYMAEADELYAAIESQFGATVEGYETYRYHEGLDRLRAWICFPLAVGIGSRAAGTVDALISPALWTEDGLLTEARTTTRWDRSTLYALRGMFTVGCQDRAVKPLLEYVQRRLLGDHVPYCVEAFPEGNQSQLSAESGLFCRIFTEGLFGIRPTGFDEFECTPRLPSKWPEVTLTNIHAFARVWNLHLASCSGGVAVAVTLANGGEVYRAIAADGETHTIRF